MLGKRKRDTAVSSRKKTPTTDTDTEKNTQNHHDLFKQYFEARFKPIDIAPVVRGADADVSVESGSEEDTHSGSEWDGLSEEDEEEDEQPVEVIAYDDASRRREEDELARAEFKSFMTSKPPSASHDHLNTNTKTKPSSSEPSQPATATESLKNDLSLQRLLSESHLLTPPSPTTSFTTTPTGKNRHKATDLRIQSLTPQNGTSTPTSLFTQEKMPLAHRKGIIAKSAEREEKRRREARENGVVLEKRKQGNGKPDGKRRERGVGGPGVGSFRGGMLRLSRRDVMEIEGPKKKGKGGKRGGRGRGKK